jgi:hypothetical protein
LRRNPFESDYGAIKLSAESGHLLAAAVFDGAVLLSVPFPNANTLSGSKINPNRDLLRYWESELIQVHRKAHQAGEKCAATLAWLLWMRLETQITPPAVPHQMHIFAEMPFFGSQKSRKVALPNIRGNLLNHTEREKKEAPGRLTGASPTAQSNFPVPQGSPPSRQRMPKAGL